MPHSLRIPLVSSTKRRYRSLTPDGPSLTAAFKNARVIRSNLDGRVFPGSRLLNYAANTYLYSLNVLLPFFVMVYVDLGLFGDPGRIRKRYMPQIVVGILMIALNLLNYSVPVIYYITEQNVYERRP